MNVIEFIKKKLLIKLDFEWRCVLFIKNKSYCLGIWYRDEYGSYVKNSFK